MLTNPPHPTADAGILDPSITEATLCPWLDFNNNTELAKFGLHNGGLNDGKLLNEKWESIGVVPVNNDGTVASDKYDEYFVFSISDNDFVTQNGKISYPHHGAGPRALPAAKT